jgi:hypothetical protein
MTDDPPSESRGEPLGYNNHRSIASRFLWNAAGTLSLSLGIVGIVIPLLPTTPFLLLATACYLRGSVTMYNWMLTNRYFGTYLREYREGKGIRQEIKVVTIVLLWVVLGLSAIFVTDNVIVRIALLVVGVGVSIHILTIKQKK